MIEVQVKNITIEGRQISRLLSMRKFVISPKCLFKIGILNIWDIFLHPEYDPNLCQNRFFLWSGTNRIKNYNAASNGFCVIANIDRQTDRETEALVGESQVKSLQKIFAQGH